MVVAPEDVEGSVLEDGASEGGAGLDELLYLFCGVFFEEGRVWKVSVGTWERRVRCKLTAKNLKAFLEEVFGQHHGYLSSSSCPCLLRLLTPTVFLPPASACFASKQSPVPSSLFKPRKRELSRVSVSSSDESSLESNVLFVRIPSFLNRGHNQAGARHRVSNRGLFARSSLVVSPLVWAQLQSRCCV